MATNNQGNQSFKQIEGESWISTYLPALSAGTVMAIVLLLKPAGLFGTNRVERV